MAAKKMTTLYLSHSAGKSQDPDWWIVEPRDDVEHLRPQVEGLLRARRRVIQVTVWPLGGQMFELTGLPDSLVESTLNEMLYRGGR